MDDFQFLVLNYTSKIINKLHDGIKSPEFLSINEIKDLAGVPRKAADAGSTCNFEVDLAETEELQGGGRIGPQPADDVPETWHVMAQVDSDSFGGAKVFQRTGALPATVSHNRFVGLLYPLLLGRAADGHGLADYTRRLDEGEITRHKLLKIIMTSDEYRIHNHNRVFLVMGEELLVIASRAISGTGVVSGRVVLIEEV